MFKLNKTGPSRRCWMVKRSKIELSQCSAIPHPVRLDGSTFSSPSLQLHRCESSLIESHNPFLHSLLFSTGSQQVQSELNVVFLLVIRIVVSTLCVDDGSVGVRGIVRSFGFVGKVGTLKKGIFVIFKTSQNQDKSRVVSLIYLCVSQNIVRELSEDKAWRTQPPRQLRQ